MIVRADALHLPLRDASVDLIVTSPPYFALRSYQDGGEHYAGQLGSETTPAAFVDALIAATAEMARVLKPSGSIFVNLGDKYAGSGGHNNSGISPKSTLRGNGHVGGVSADGAENKIKATRRSAPDRYNQSATIGRRLDKDGQRYVQGDIPKKSLMGLPWRYANAAVDRLGLILRAELIWSKPNGLPESVTDRVRRSHEQWFHLTKAGRYFSAIDELRQPTHREGLTWEECKAGQGRNPTNGDNGHNYGGPGMAAHPLGALPGSVWTIPSEPLTVPDWARDKYNLPDHFAAFPQEWPRRIILGWSPSGICTKCGEGRRPVVDKRLAVRATTNWGDKFVGEKAAHMHNRMGTDEPIGSTEAIISGYACGCDAPIAPTRPAVVLDPFGGTGTVAMVARTLGRVGINCDLSGDYCRLARWRIYESGHAAKSEDRTWRDAQGAML